MNTHTKPDTTRRAPLCHLCMQPIANGPAEHYAECPAKKSVRDADDEKGGTE